ncbi:YihY/virulence factor BrkB family protein [Cellulosimicrobium terreum]|nr:YihY/virulence factor BrkB family protein [Cellulosimicrobium terreum]
MIGRATTVAEWWKDSRPGRSVYRYFYARGALLSGGIAYSALFSLFAGLTIGYTVFMQVLGGRKEFADAVFAQINEFVPGLIAVDGEPGVVSPDDLLLDSGLSVTSVVAAGVLLFSAVTFMYHLRGAIRTMFGVSDVGQSPVLGRLRGLLGFILLAVSIVVSAAAGIVVTTLGTQVLDALGVSGRGAVLVGAAGLVVSTLLDSVVVALVVVLLAGVDVRRWDLLAGSLSAGIAFGGLRYLGATVIASGASRNALLASFAVIATLLVLVNVVARILLLVCAWMADPPRERDPEPGGARHSRGGRPELPVVDGAGAAQARHLAPPATHDERLRVGQGRGRPWSPLVRGFRRGRLPRTS